MEKSGIKYEKVVKSRKKWLKIAKSGLKVVKRGDKWGKS